MQKNVFVSTLRIIHKSMQSTPLVSDSYNDGGYDGGPIFPFDLLIVVRDSYNDGGYDVPNR